MTAGQIRSGQNHRRRWGEKKSIKIVKVTPASPWLSNACPCRAWHPVPQQRPCCNRCARALSQFLNVFASKRKAPVTRDRGSTASDTVSKNFGATGSRNELLQYSQEKQRWVLKRPMMPATAEGKQDSCSIIITVVLDLCCSLRDMIMSHWAPGFDQPSILEI
jgi:hypothetical protein